MISEFANSLDRCTAVIDLIRGKVLIHSRIVWAYFRRPVAQQEIQELEEILLCSIHVSGTFFSGSKFLIVAN